MDTTGFDLSLGSRPNKRMARAYMHRMLQFCIDGLWFGIHVNIRHGRKESLQQAGRQGHDERRVNTENGYYFVEQCEEEGVEVGSQPLGPLPCEVAVAKHQFVGNFGALPELVRLEEGAKGAADNVT